MSDKSRVAILYSSSQNSLKLFFFFFCLLVFLVKLMSQSFIHQVRILSRERYHISKVNIDRYLVSRNPLFIKSEFSPRSRISPSVSVPAISSQSFIHQVRILSSGTETFGRAGHGQPLSQSFIHQVRILSPLRGQDLFGFILRLPSRNPLFIKSEFSR